MPHNPPQPPSARRLPCPTSACWPRSALSSPNICPYYIWIHEDMMGPLARHYGVQDVKATVVRDHQVIREVLALKEYTTPDTYLDDFGSLWRQGAVFCASSVPALDAPSLPAAIPCPIFRPMRILLGWRSGSTPIGTRFESSIRYALLRAHVGVTGMENIMMDIRDNPRFVDELLDGLESLCCSVIDRLVHDFGDRVDAIGFSDDMGAQRSMLISPAMWRRFLKPHQARACTAGSTTRARWCICTPAAMSSRSSVAGGYRHEHAPADPA